MELRRKLAVLADAAKYDASCASSGAAGRRAAPGGVGSTDGTGICHSYTPDGRCVSLLKVLLTNVCIYDCRYCVSRISNDVERARFTPEEVVTLTLGLYRRNAIEGLFLSSGVIKSPDYTMEQLARVAQLLRDEHLFAGYIHLKAPPGAARELLAMAGRYADRLSVNIELPTPADLAKLAPEKKPDAIDFTMKAIADRHQEAAEEKQRFAPAGQTTQMIVGATDTTDRAILATTTRLYRTHKLRRVYFSAFSPIPGSDARLPAQAPPLVREHRLYEADWLMRHYGFAADELTTEESPTLDPHMDPKLAWALRHRALFPVDLNRAPREMLLRVPGLGVKNVDRILAARRHRTIRVEDLATLKVPLRRALPFLVAGVDVATAARRLDSAQLSLFTVPELASSRPG